MKKLIYFILLLLVQKVNAQKLGFTDTGTDTLQDITVHAFMLNKKWKDAPVAVALISQSEIQRSAPTSLLPALNSVAGVRMEERSPGSYRLSIRGSTLRSPFGVRNVKVYWNDIPLTDGGGNTYLNLIDVSQIIETFFLNTISYFRTYRCKWPLFFHNQQSIGFLYTF